jgi:hypothetical protein
MGIQAVASDSKRAAAASCRITSSSLHRIGNVTWRRAELYINMVTRPAIYVNLFFLFAQRTQATGNKHPNIEYVIIGLL